MASAHAKAIALTVSSLSVDPRTSSTIVLGVPMMTCDGSKRMRRVARASAVAATIPIFFVVASRTAAPATAAADSASAVMPRSSSCGAGSATRSIKGASKNEIDAQSHGPT